MRVCVQSLSHVRFFATLWTVAHQAPLFMGFSRQEYWSGLPFPSPGDLPSTGVQPGPPALQTDTLLSEPPGINASFSWSSTTLSTMWETWVRYLSREDPLEKEMAAHSSAIAWKIPWTEEPGRLQSMESQRVGHD